MDEADRCSMVGLMYAGKLVVCAPPKQIRSQLKGEIIELYPERRQSAHNFIGSLSGILEIQTYGEALHILVDSVSIRLPQIKKSLEEKGILYHGARPAPARMEEAFISLIRQIEQNAVSTANPEDL
jgi:ABC-2 type transport system ATP-binding protein